MNRTLPLFQGLEFEGLEVESPNAPRPPAAQPERLPAAAPSGSNVMRSPTAAPPLNPSAAAIISALRIMVSSPSLIMCAPHSTGRDRTCPPATLIEFTPPAGRKQAKYG